MPVSERESWGLGGMPSHLRVIRGESTLPQHHVLLQDEARARSAGKPPFTVSCGVSSFPSDGPTTFVVRFISRDSIALLLFAGSFSITVVF